MAAETKNVRQNNSGSYETHTVIIAVVKKFTYYMEGNADHELYNFLNNFFGIMPVKRTVCIRMYL